MTDEQRAALVYSQSVACLVELEAMKAENVARTSRGEALVYGEEQFRALIERYGIGWNEVLGRFRD